MTRSASLILAAVLGGIVVGGIVWLTKPEPVTTPAVPQATSPLATKPPATLANTLPAPSPSQAPPWADSSGVVAGPSSASLASAISMSPSKRSEKARQRDAIRARIQKLTANGRHPTPAEMNDVLGDLERVEGSSALGGVNIAALRENLVAVDKLQKLSLELQAESQKPGGGDKQKIQSILAQLKQIQANMNYNVAAPVGTPAVTPRR